MTDLSFKNICNLKNMKISKILLLIIVTLGTLSCVNKSGDDLDDSCAISDSHPLLNYLSLVNKETRNSGRYTVTPLMCNGDTVMFVAQYDDGWELYSSDMRFPMLIMKSPTGTFNQSSMPDAVKLQISGMAETIQKTIASNEELPMDSSWYWANPQRDMLPERTTRTNEEKPDFSRPGEWVLINVIDYGTQVSQIPHLVKTKWGQDTPWNNYVPFDMQDPLQRHSAAGCTVVATAQYAYHLHSKDGVPAMAPVKGIYNTASNWYSFSNFTTAAWGAMARMSAGTNTTGAAVFIGYVASKIVPPSNFHYAGTGVGVKRAISQYLNPETNLEFIDDKLSVVKIPNIIKEIQNGYPVIAVGFDGSDPNGEGHTFLIDSYRKETQTIEYTYGWNGYTLSGKDPNLRDPDGNILVYGIQKTVKETPAKEFFGMNWGENGYYDDTLTSLSSWKMGNTYYNKDQEIALRKTN